MGKTVGELKAMLAEYPDDKPVRMCMDWTELEDPPKHLQQQWDDALGDVADNGREVILLNVHFK